MKYSLAGGWWREGRERVAEQGLQLKAAEKGVAVLRFPRGSGKGEEGATRQHCKGLIQRLNVGYSVIQRELFQGCRMGGEGADRAVLGVMGPEDG